MREDLRCRDFNCHSLLDSLLFGLKAWQNKGFWKKQVGFCIPVAWQCRSCQPCILGSLASKQRRALQSCGEWVGAAVLLDNTSASLGGGENTLIRDVVLSLMKFPAFYVYLKWLSMKSVLEKKNRYWLHCHSIFMCLFFSRGDLVNQVTIFKDEHFKD